MSVALVSQWRKEADEAHGQLIKMAWDAGPEERQFIYNLTGELSMVKHGLVVIASDMTRRAQRSLDCFGGE